MHAFATDLDSLETHLRSQSTALHQTTTQLRDITAQCEALKHDKARLKQQLASMRDTLESKVALIAAATAAIDRSVELKEHIARLQARLEEQAGQVRKNSEELQVVQAGAAQLEAALDDTRQLNEDLQQQVFSAKADAQAARDTIDAQRQQLDSMQQHHNSELAKLKRDYEAKLFQLTSAANGIGGFSSAQARDPTETQLHQIKIQALRREVQQLRSELASTRTKQPTRRSSKAQQQQKRRTPIHASTSSSDDEFDF